MTIKYLTDIAIIDMQHIYRDVMSTLLQRGAVLANELKNNACKLAKWTVQAILAGVENIKFG